MNLNKNSSLIVLCLGAAALIYGCSGGDTSAPSDEDKSDKEEGAEVSQCVKSYECGEDYVFCVDGACQQPSSAPKCQRTSDCPDSIVQTCRDGRCLTYECKDNSSCDANKKETCQKNKCEPDCLKDADCKLKYGDNWRCFSKVCNETGGDMDEMESEAEQEEEYVDPCANLSSYLTCSDFKNSCAYSTLSCSDFANRDWMYCYNEYNDNKQNVGRTVYFGGGDWFREFLDNTFACGKDDKFCYFGRNGRRQGEINYLDQQGNHLLYGFFSLSFVRIECGETIECYDSAVMSACPGFPYPPYYIPPQTHAIVCTDKPAQ